MPDTFIMPSNLEARRKYNKEYYSNPENRKRHAEQEAKRRESPAYRDHQANYKKEWDKAPENKDKKLQYYKANREHILAYHRKRNTDPELKLYTSLQKRRASGFNKYKSVLYFAQEGRCNYCERELAIVDLHIDHRIPRNHNGPNALANLQLLCTNCNIVKHDHIETPELIEYCKALTLEACKIDNHLIRPRDTPTRKEFSYNEAGRS